MPSERARPLVAFVVIACACGLVIAANMLRHPTATTTAVVAAQLSDAGSRVELGTVLTGAPTPPPAPEVSTGTGNVLGVALRRPVVSLARQAGTSGTAARRLQHRVAGYRQHAGQPHGTAAARRTRQHAPAPTTHPVRGHLRGHRAAVTSHRQHSQHGNGHGHGRKSSSARAGHSQHGNGHANGHANGHGHGRDAGRLADRPQRAHAPHGHDHHGGHGGRGHAGGHGRG